MDLGSLFTSFYDNTVGNILGMWNAGMDSLGLSQHGRDQYFAREMQREFLNTQIAAQQSENQKNRDFSKQMYEQQWADILKNSPELLKMQSDAQFNLWKQQFEQQNAFNDPRSQVQRMMAAGLNPVGGTGTVAENQMNASSVAPPSHINGSPLGGSVSPIGLPQGLSSNGAELRAVGEFMKNVAQAKESGSRKIGQDLENKFLDASLENRIKQVALQNKWTEEQTALFTEQFAEINSRINLNFAQKKYTDKQIDWFDKEMSAKIGELKASKEYQEALSKFGDKQRELLEAMFDDLKNYQMYSTQQMEKFVGLLDKYGDAQAIIGMLSQVVSSATDLVGLFTPQKKVVEVLHGKK